jgi:hypothetical protein
VKMRAPMGQDSREVEPLETIGALAVVDDPFGEGFAVVVVRTGLGIGPHRFESAEAAAGFARDIAELTDWAKADTKRRRAEVEDDRELRDRVEQAASRPGLLAAREPTYSPGSKSGASYEQGYDAERKARRREE